jgi:hypothetical protein
MDKTCPRCGETKPPSAYYPHPKRRDGLSSWCVDCGRETVAESYLKQRQQVIDHLGSHCVECGYCADDRALQIDHVNSDGAEQRRTGAGRGRALLHAVLTDEAGRYQLLCANCNAVKRIAECESGARTYNRTPPVTLRVTKRCPHCATTKPVSEFVRNAARHDGLSSWCAVCMASDRADSYRRLRLRAVAHLGSRCKQCGYAADNRALVIDHVNGDGGVERKSGTVHRAALNAALKATPGRYQLLCANCNVIKRFDRREHVGRVYERTIPTNRVIRPSRRWSAAARAAQSERWRALWQNPEHRARESQRRSELMRARWAAGEVPNKPRE